MLWRKLKQLMRNNRPSYVSLQNLRTGNNIRTVNWDDVAVSGTSKRRQDTRKEVKPVEVFKEVISEVPGMDMADLDNKIKIVKERIHSLSRHLDNYSLTDEKVALQFLKARQKLVKNPKRKEMFNWPATNKDIISKLCKKYKLKMAPMSSYYKTVPKEGVDEMNRYADAFNKITKQDPTFKIIVDDKGKEDKKDPILLAESPFGNWYYVLGAWDKEIEIVDDIVYKGK